MDNILVEHRQYMRIPATTSVHSYFEGKTYLLPADIQGTDANRYIALDPKFHQNAREIKEDYKEMDAEKIEVKSFLRLLLNTCVTEADVSALLPKSLYVPPFTTAMMLTPQEVNKFRRENLCFVETIKRRMVENLLLK